MKQMKILIAMPIYKRELLALNSIRSIMEITEIDKTFDVTMALGINEMDDMLESFLSNYKPTTGIKLAIHKFDTNLGKGIAVNKLASLYEFDYVISIDSDMICTDKDWLKKMVYVYLKYNNNPATNRSDKSPRLMGSLCSNQSGLNCHAIPVNSPSRIELKIDDRFTIISHRAGSGVAGGVLMSDKDTWKLIGGYNGSKVYAADDGHYHGDCQANNRVVGYIKEVSFYHPFEFKDEYRVWKDKIVAEKEIFIPHKTEQIKEGK